MQRRPLITFDALYTAFEIEQRIVDKPVADCSGRSAP